MSGKEILPSGWAVLDDDFISCSNEVRKTGNIEFDPFDSLPVCRKYWTPGATVLDIGAHIGNWSVPMAQSVGSTGKVVCLEPDPELCECLRINMDRVGTPYDLIPKAAWEYTGQIVFLRNMENRGCSACDPELKNQGNHPALTVDCVKIDDLGVSRVSFIKIDTEGSEWKVLMGAERTLERDRPTLFVEALEHAPLFFGYTLQEMYVWLTGIGYRFEFYPPPSGVPGHGPPAPHDVLCIHG